MPPKKKPTDQNGGTRVTTRASNANKHPGTEAKKTLQVHNRREPEVIQAEKEQKKAAKEAKEEARQAEASQREVAQRNLEECRARQAASLEHEDEIFSKRVEVEQQAKGGKKVIPSNSKTPVANKPVGAVASNPHQPISKTSSGRSTTPVRVESSSRIRGQKRKSDPAPPASDDEQPVTGKKKAKKSQSADPNPPQRPAPRPTSQVLKTQLAATGSARKSTSDSVSGVAIVETAEEQAATRKRPAEGEVVDEGTLMTWTPVSGPPSKKVKASSNAKGNKPQALRRTETLIEMDNQSVKLRHTNRDVEILDNNTSSLATPGPRPHRENPQVEQMDTDIETDDNVNEPYKTPVALQKKKRTMPAQVIESSEDENSQVEQKKQNLKAIEKKGKKGQRPVPNNATQKQSTASTTHMTAAHGQPERSRTSRVTGIDPRSESGTRLSTSKKLDHTDSGSVAGSESIAAKSQAQASGTQHRATAVTARRMTASHNIAAKTGNLISKNKEKGSKGKQKDSTAPDPDINEDDSQERKAALSSPIKGKTSRELSKTGVRIRRTSKPSAAPIPKDAEPKFSGIVVPTWLQKFAASGENPWRSPGEEDRAILRTLCEIVLGDDFKIDISEHSDAWKKCSGQESQYRHRMKTLAFENVLEKFISEYKDDPDAMKKERKRIEYGQYWCETHEWKFLYGRIEDGSLEDVYMGPLITETFAAHYNSTTTSKIVQNYDVGLPLGGIALAISAVEHALKMFRDDRLEYKNGTLQVKMPEIPGVSTKNDKQKPKRTTKFDFSGTNYQTCTFGHLACLEAMFEDDPKSIENICERAREIAGVRKPCDDRDSNNKYATMQADPEFLARALLFKKVKKSNGGAEVINGNDGTLPPVDDEEDNCSDNHHCDRDGDDSADEDINTNLNHDADSDAQAASGSNIDVSEHESESLPVDATQAASDSEPESVVDSDGNRDVGDDDSDDFYCDE